MTASRRRSCGSAGSRRRASATFVSGPVATSVSSPGRLRASSTIRSGAIARRDRGAALRADPRSRALWDRGSSQCAAARRAASRFRRRPRRRRRRTARAPQACSPRPARRRRCPHNRSLRRARRPAEQPRAASAIASSTPVSTSSRKGALTGPRYPTPASERSTPGIDRLYHPSAESVRIAFVISEHPGGLLPERLARYRQAEQRLSELARADIVTAHYTEVDARRRRRNGAQRLLRPLERP